MSLWRQITRGLRALTNRTLTDREIADEVDSFLEQSTAAWMERGLSLEDARRAARLEMGSPTAAREQIREYGWENAIDTLFADLRYAVRRLWRTPSFSAATVLTIALGIGATIAIFSAVAGVLLKPLPYPHSDRLVALLHTAPGIGIKDVNMAPSLYFTYSDESRVFEGVSLWANDSWTVTGMAEPEQVRGLSVSQEFLRTLGVQLELGRGFTTADEIPGSERVVILSDSFWRARFGGDRSILGRQLLLDGNGYTVVGVLPPSFRFMDRQISLIAPFRFNRAEVPLIQFCCQGIARLKPGVTLADADTDVARMLPMAAAKFPMNPGLSRTLFEDARIAPRLQPLKDFLAGSVRSTLWVLMGTVGILLAIANVANLMLVRTDARRQELATRAALGAGAWRIARELLLESVLVSCAGGALGVAIAAGAVQWFTAAAALHLPRMEEISIDPAVLAFAACLSLVTGVLFGLVPVYRYARPAVSTELRSGGRSLTGSRARLRARGTLVSAQVALALVLLVGSGLMIRTALVLHGVDPGFSGAPDVQTIRIGIPATQVKDAESVTRMEEEILRRVEAIPGVSQAAIVNRIPMDGGSNDPVYAEDWSPQGGGTPPIRRFKFISPGYVPTVGSHLVAGRDLTWADLYGRAPVAMISENLAREFWRNPAAAVGKHVRAGPKSEWRQVIGVIANLHDDGVDRPAPAIVYWPLLLKQGSSDSGNRNVAYVIRTSRAGSTALSQEIRQAVGAVNGSLPVADVKTLQSVYEQSLARTSFTLMLLAIAGMMALALGVVGIYGTISFSVAQRTREVGIRLALGSPPRDITTMFVRQGLVEAGAGLVCGLAAAFALTQLMESVLFGVSPADPATYLIASAALVTAAGLASYLPAHRATRINPVDALRAE
ncbi:MAG TPA: ABC transporter permease [Candidatus Acidoferrum sp.]|nr:ABC transporter permease [Candidatus Acidoferrum sp.]